jgi:hypothetical protein
MSMSDFCKKKVAPCAPKCANKKIADKTCRAKNGEGVNYAGKKVPAVASPARPAALARPKFPIGRKGSLCLDMNKQDCDKAKVGCHWIRKSKNGIPEHCVRRPKTIVDMSKLQNLTMSTGYLSSSNSRLPNLRGEDEVNVLYLVNMYDTETNKPVSTDFLRQWFDEKRGVYDWVIEASGSELPEYISNNIHTDYIPDNMFVKENFIGFSGYISGEVLDDEIAAVEAGPSLVEEQEYTLIDGTRRRLYVKNVHLMLNDE